MRRLLRSALVLWCCAGVLGARQASDASRLARDPDRGLDDAFRERLALVDAAKDTWVVERWAQLIDARLEVLARLWSENRLEELSGLAWIRPELRVTPLFAKPSESAKSGEWTVSGEASAASNDSVESSFASALSAWRAMFPGEARLDHVLFAIDGDPPELASRIRLTASGPLADARLQHNAEWTCTWRLVPQKAVDPAGASPVEPAVELIGLRMERFESVLLASHPHGLFADVTESVLGTALFRAEVAPGLDDWRRTIPSPLEPGSLGHHGLAVADADGDGLEDVYWCRPGGLPNRLLLHASDDGVRDASAAAGVDLLDYSSSALLADLDSDGDNDLLVGTGASLVFFANDGRAKFEQKLRMERSLATSLAAADYDADGDLDVYVCSYVSPYEKNGMPVPYFAAENGEENALLRNDGEWVLADATKAAGMDENNERFSLAAAWEDFDNDGDPDLYVANDFGRNNLYRNEGGHFRDVAAELGALDIAAGMGVAWADVDDDGWMDLYVTNMESPAGRRLTSRPDFRVGTDATTEALRHHAQGNSLFLNGKGGTFRDASVASGTARGRWGWGSIFLDFDNDGALDLFAPNGFVTGEDGPTDLDSFFWRQVVLKTPEVGGEPGEAYTQGWRAVNRLVRQGHSWNGHERNAAFLALGKAEFADVSSASGLDLDDDARAAARVDWDGDGDEDLIVTNRTGPMLRVLENQATHQNWIAFALKGQGNHTAIGARVELETILKKRLIRTLRCGEGYLAQSSGRVHFGLGGDGVRRLTVRWPGGGSEEFGSPATGALYVLEQGTGRPLAVPARGTASRLGPSEPRAPASNGSTRTVLPTPLPIPRLALESWEGQAASVLGITMQGPRGTGKPLVLLVWSSAAPAARGELERFVAAAEPFGSEGFQVLALSADAGDERERARALLAELAWPFARAFASEEALQILELVLGTLHDDAHALALPCAFLIDAGGRLVATYEGRIDPERVLRDRDLFELSPEARRDACVPFPGRWIAAPPASMADKLAARLDAHGLERAAAEYRLAQVEVRTLTAARLSYEKGVEAHRAGRLAEAIAQYMQALESDPSFALAAQDLAVALHQKGELEAAKTAYKRALKLDPAHALTRCNLGYLYLALGDVASARQELDALRTLRSELAAQLAARIEEVEQTPR